MLSKETVEKISKYFANQPVNKAWLFGSFARNEEHAGSDVDILVTLDECAHVGLIKFSGMRLDLKELLQRDIDLVVDGALMPFAVESVDRDKVLIYERAS